MANDAARAEFWAEFMLARLEYPAPDRLEAQFAQAVFSDFCDCGCNSFALTVGPDTLPLVPAGGGYGSIYVAEFMLDDERTLEIILFADESGNLAYVEVDCCSNSQPVPEIIIAHERPFHTHASEELLK